MYLGIDLGTSGVKVVVLEAGGKVVAQASQSLSVSRPQPLWSEQHPADWWAATEAAILQLPPGLRAEVEAIGLAGQMHGATLLGADDRPLRPAILWNDGRSGAECSMLEAAVPSLRALAGNIAMPGFTAPKLAWVRAHEPAVFAATRCVLLPKDYLRLKMTGEKISDMSDSAGTLWLDGATRCSQLPGWTARTCRALWKGPRSAATCGLTLPRAGGCAPYRWQAVRATMPPAQ